MDLPLLLAGPLLRRVEPGLVSVWLALREAADVRLLVWEGLVRVQTSMPGTFAVSQDTRLLRVGAKLYVGEVTLELPATTGKSFQPDSAYSYDVEIRRPGSGAVDTLDSLRMLQEGVFDGFARIPLGFEEKGLPSFAPPPSDLEHLHLLYGSCRRPLHRDPDALAMVDDLIFGHQVYKDPRARPHQLFLGGDQIYADDVSVIHMPTVIETGVELIGTQPGVTPPEPLEQLPVDQVARRKSAITDPDDVDRDAPWTAYDLDASPGDADRLIPADRSHWPEGRRLRTTQVDAQLTSTDGDSHLLSLGDFAACYLSVWSPAVWGEEVIGARWAPDASKPQQSQPLRWDQELPALVKGKPETGAIVLTDVEFPETIAGHFYEEPAEPPEEKSADDLEDDRHQHQLGLRRAFAVHAEFRKNLPKVQRALANVATYMILDDHDVTDDYFLNPVWRRRVLGSRLGRALLGNAMTAYALFQDWGNDPVAYRTGPKAQLLALVEQLFPEGATTGPDPTAFAAISELMGHHPDGGLVPLPGGRTESAEAAAEVALRHRRPEAPGDRPRQPHPSSVRRSQRPAGQHLADRDGRPDPRPAAPSRAGDPDRGRAAAGDRAAGPRRAGRAVVLPDLRHGPGEQGAQRVQQHAAPARAGCWAPIPTRSRHGPSTWRPSSTCCGGWSPTDAWCCSPGTCTTPPARR